MANSTFEHCKFFVQRKKRYCKMLVKVGQELCGEHQKTSDTTILEQNFTARVRIACPLDTKHTVYAHNLNKHLKICNARPGHVESFIQKDINSGKSEVPPALITSDSYQMLSSFSKDRILAVIDKVNTIYEKNVEISDKKLSFHLVEEELKKPKYGDKTKKHLKQASAIIGLLKEYGMLKQKTCYVEFGAGRGQLSCWIAEATEALDNSSILLVERASPKHKRDNKLARTSNRIQRVRADIADLVLDKIDALKHIETIIGVSKHLCGEATDLAIRCLVNSGIRAYGALLTFCCHHRCRWTPYTGKTFFKSGHSTNIL